MNSGNKYPQNRMDTSQVGKEADGSFSSSKRTKQPKNTFNQQTKGIHNNMRRTLNAVQAGDNEDGFRRPQSRRPGFMNPSVGQKPAEEPRGRSFGPSNRRKNAGDKDNFSQSDRISHQDGFNKPLYHRRPIIEQRGIENLSNRPYSATRGGEQYNEPNINNTRPGARNNYLNQEESQNFRNEGYGINYQNGGNYNQDYYDEIPQKPGYYKRYDEQPFGKEDYYEEEYFHNDYYHQDGYHQNSQKRIIQKHEMAPADRRPYTEHPQTALRQNQLLRRIRPTQPGFRTRPLKTLRIGLKRPSVAVQVNAQRKGILPIINPTANPFKKFIKVPRNAEQLKKLQIKLNLSSLSEAPRSYSQRLKETLDVDAQMNEDNSKAGRLRIFERFQKIQNAQRALHPLTIKLLNEKRGIFGEEGEVYKQKPYFQREVEQENIEETPYKGKNAIGLRIQSKKLGNKILKPKRNPQQKKE